MSQAGPDQPEVQVQVSGAVHARLVPQGVEQMGVSQAAPVQPVAQVQVSGAEQVRLPLQAGAQAGASRAGADQSGGRGQGA